MIVKIMRTQKKQISALILFVALVLLPFTSLSRTVYASTTINLDLYSNNVSSAENAINDALSSNTAVTVTGSLTSSGAAMSLTELTIGKTLVWQAGMDGVTLTLNGTGDGGTLEIAAGGSISNSAQPAILDSPGKHTVRITGGSVSSSSGRVVIAAVLDMSSGSVSSLTSSTDPAIFGKTINLNGGSVTAVSGCAISATTLNIHAGSISSSGNVSAISATTLTMGGGSVSFSGTGSAISAQNTTITGGFIATASELAIQDFPPGGTISISGGTIFGYGDDTGLLISVNTTSVTGDSQLIAWDNSVGVTDYSAGDISHLSTYPAGSTAVWDSLNNLPGIRYTNGSNTGFLPLPIPSAVTVAGSLTPDPDASGGPDDSDSGIGGLSTSGDSLSTTGDSTQPALRLTGLPAEIRVGDSFTLTPNADDRIGDAGWIWDDGFFDASFNSPATFTALKEGTTFITYTASDSRSISLTVNILAVGEAGEMAVTDEAKVDGENPRTGGDGPVNAWLAAGSLLFLGIVLYFHRWRRG